MARKTREEAEQTRNLLLDAAERLFSERGVSKTTLADIAAEAGVTRGAVYWHFQNKLDVYRALLYRITPLFDDFQSEMTRTAERDPALALWRHSVTLLSMLSTLPQLRRVLLILFLRSEHVDELAPIHDECVAHMRESGECLRGILQLAQAQGLLLPHVDCQEAALALQAYHDGLINRWLLDPEHADLAGKSQRLLQYVYRAIFQPSVMAHLFTAD